MHRQTDRALCCAAGAEAGAVGFHHRAWLTATSADTVLMHFKMAKFNILLNFICSVAIVRSSSHCLYTK